MLWNRLSQEITPGCEHLVEVLVRLAPEDERDRLLIDVATWILCPVPAFASGVANSLDGLKTPIDSSFERQLRNAFEYWTSGGTWCSEHKIRTYGGSCPECRLVVPCPRAAILRQLGRIGALSYDELASLLDDKQHAVASTAEKTVLNMASNDAAIVAHLLAEIGAGHLPSSWLEKVAALPAGVRDQNTANLIDLLKSLDKSVRCATLSILSGQWVRPADARPFAQMAIEDPEPAVRTQAVRTLRAISERL